jgi:hypothetical protein
MDKINFEWEKLWEEGQMPYGFIEIYATVVKDFTNKENRVLAILHYLPHSIIIKDKQREVHVTLFFEGEKNEFDQVLYLMIYQDIGEIVHQNEDNRFPEESKQINYLFQQTLIVREIPKIIGPYNHGSFDV